MLPCSSAYHTQSPTSLLTACLGGQCHNHMHKVLFLGLFSLKPGELEENLARNSLEAASRAKVPAELQTEINLEKPRWGCGTYCRCCVCDKSTNPVDGKGFPACCPWEEEHPLLHCLVTWAIHLGNACWWCRKQMVKGGEVVKLG